MVFKRSIGYIDSKAKKNIRYQGFGGQAFISGYGFKTRNVKNPEDPVPYTPSNYPVKVIMGEQWITGSGVGHSWSQYVNNVIDF